MNNPYSVGEFTIKDHEDYFYCYTCHAPHLKKCGYNKYYMPVIGEGFMRYFRTCKRELCQLDVDGFNNRHEAIKNLSLSQGNDAVLI